jgi:L-Ala-D/L-Glu epimerase
MQIARIACVAVDIPYRKTFRIAGGGVDVQSNVLVKVVADDGTAGYGEASPLISYSEESQGTAIHIIRDVLAPGLIGQDPRDVDRLDDLMAHTIEGHPFAKGGLSMAVYDLAARAMDLPVYRLLGGKRLDRVPFVATVGIGETEEMVADAAGLAAAGFRDIKVKIGNEPAIDLARLAAIRGAVGPDIGIRADANQGYRSGDALPLLRRMEAVGLRWFEQPVPRWDRDGMARLAQALDTNILADESAFTPEDVFSMARHEAADVINIKCSKYGLGNARRMAAVARAANLPCMVGSMQSMGLGLAAGLHFCAANDFPYACELDSALYLVDDVLAGDPFSAVPPGNAWPVPDGAGYGVTLKSVWEEALDGVTSGSRIREG